MRTMRAMRQRVQNTEAALQYLTEFVTETIRGESREAARKSIEFAFRRVPSLRQRRNQWRPLALAWIGVTPRRPMEALDPLCGLDEARAIRD